MLRCPDVADRFRRILAYFIPCHLINTHTVPTSALLAPYPRLASLFQPLARAIRRGDLAAFDAALVAGESELVRRRIYLTCERARDIALRNLLRKVYIAGGFESRDGEGPLRRTRVPVAEFVAAVQLGSARANIDCDEVECMLANMIYKVRSSPRARAQLTSAELDEGLHRARSRHRRAEQGGGVSRDWRLTGRAKLLDSGGAASRGGVNEPFPSLIAMPVARLHLRFVDAFF